jgi:hypothetical protein
MTKGEFIDLLEKYADDAELVFSCDLEVTAGENLFAVYSIEEEVMDMKRLYINLTI